MFSISDIIGPFGASDIVSSIYRHVFQRKEAEEQIDPKSGYLLRALSLGGLAGMIFVALNPKTIWKYMEWRDGGSTEATKEPTSNTTATEQSGLFSPDEFVQQPKVPMQRVENANLARR